LTAVLAALTALTASAPVAAQNYPTKPIRFIVPFSPGGGTDLQARAIAQRLQETWGQPVVVDHRPGGTGAVASVVVAQAVPDGYTILIVTSSTHAIGPNLMRKPPYNPVKDFAPVAQTASAPEILVAHPSVPATTVKELVALAKAKPQAVNYASAGTGTIGHMTAELFNIVAGTKIVHIPYKGTGAAVRELLGGQVQILFGAPGAVIQQVRAGKLKALASATRERLPEMKDMPTLAEAGFPGIEASNWYGVLTTAAVPKAIIEKLNAEIVRTIQAPDMKEALARQGYEARPSTPEEFGKLIREDFAKWNKVVKASGMQPE
jgi:tripartite-type tricarboxylate transporter receptor subunit TctC